MADDGYVSFEEVLRELQLTAQQLKQLVQEGEVRAFRGEHNTIKFRREYIDRMKSDSSWRRLLT